MFAGIHVDVILSSEILVYAHCKMSTNCEAKVAKEPIAYLTSEISVISYQTTMKNNLPFVQESIVGHPRTVWQSTATTADARLVCGSTRFRVKYEMVRERDNIEVLPSILTLSIRFLLLNR